MLYVEQSLRKRLCLTGRSMLWRGLNLPQSSPEELVSSNVEEHVPQAARNRCESASMGHLYTRRRDCFWIDHQLVCCLLMQAKCSAQRAKW